MVIVCVHIHMMSSSSSSFSFKVYIFPLKVHMFPLSRCRTSVIFPHLIRSNAIFWSTPNSSKSLFSIFLQVFLGLPTSLFPNTYISSTNLNTSLSVSLLTSPNHCNLFCLNLSCIIFKPHLLATSSLEILSYHLTLVMYLNILLSQFFKMSSNFPVNAHVSAPYNIIDLTQLL